MPVHVGKIPDEVLPLMSLSSQIEEMAVRASFEGDPEARVQGHLLRPAHQRGFEPAGNPPNGGRTVRLQQAVAQAV